VAQIDEEALPSYSGYETIEFSREGDVLNVRFANPDSEMNVVDGRMHAELVRVFADLKNETSARAIVIHGSARAFSAGGDFRWMREQNPSTYRFLRNEGKQIVWNALDIEVPVVAAVSGPAIGLGATLALLCDVVVMSESATIGDPHVAVGLVAGDGGAVLWPMLVGPIQAKRYLLTGESLTGAQAAEIGLVSECVADDQFDEAVARWARRLAKGAPLAIAYTKLAVNQLIKQSMATAFDYSTALEVLTFASSDHAEALSAIEEERKPNFEGK